MLKGLLLILSLSLFLTGCNNNDSHTLSNKDLSLVVDSKGGETLGHTLRKDIPKGAIKVEDDLYYVPIEKDDRGCMMYRAYSVNNATYAVIMYRNESGKFTSNSRLPHCQ